MGDMTDWILGNMLDPETYYEEDLEDYYDYYDDSYWNVLAKIKANYLKGDFYDTIRR